MDGQKHCGWAAAFWIALQLTIGCGADFRLPTDQEPDAIPSADAAVPAKPSVADATPSSAGTRGMSVHARRSVPDDTMKAVDSAGSGGAGEPAADGGGRDSTGLMETCGREKFRAEPAPLVIHTVFDESESMQPSWTPVTDAFTRFVRDPRSAGVNIGLNLFGANCDWETYDWETPHPSDVPIGPLPQNAAPIAAQLTSRTPLSQTPTAQAMAGAMFALQDYGALHPGEKLAMLLVTDAATGLGEGDPEDCYSTASKASEVAAYALAHPLSVQTYVLGLGDAASLNVVSKAGGTGEAFSVDPSASENVLEAVHQIRVRAQSCDYALPQGGEQDPKLVNLEFTAAGGSPKTVPAVSNLSACDPVAGGWYYDSNGQPKRIIACAKTCEAFGPESEVNVILGCPTLGPD